MISDIEKEWNLTLLERGKAGVFLTSQGEKSVQREPQLTKPQMKIVENRKPRVKNAFSLETLVFLGIFGVIFGYDKIAGLSDK